MVNCMNCIHNPVCDLWRLQEGQDAASFQLSGCDHFKDCTKYAEVVRCEDCKHYRTSGCAMDTYAFDVVEEGYCSYGERREGEWKK